MFVCLFVDENENEKVAASQAELSHAEMYHKLFHKAWVPRPASWPIKVYGRLYNIENDQLVTHYTVPVAQWCEDQHSLV